MDFSLLRYKKEEVMDETYIGSFYINDNECYDLYYENCIMVICCLKKLG